MKDILKENIIVDKIFSLVARMVELYMYLCSDKKEYVLSKQYINKYKNWSKKVTQL